MERTNDAVTVEAKYHSTFVPEEVANGMDSIITILVCPLRLYFVELEGLTHIVVTSQAQTMILARMLDQQGTLL